MVHRLPFLPLPQTPQMLGVDLDLEAGVFDSILCALRWHLSAVWAEAATSTRPCDHGHSCEQAPDYRAPQLVGI